MREAVARLILLIWFGAGFALYIAKRQDLYPMATLFKLLGLWLAIGLGAAVWSARRNRNPFDKMTAAELQRMVAFVQTVGNNQNVGPSDRAWIVALASKYTPGLDENQQLSLFNAFLRRHRREMLAALTPRQNLHNGPSVVLVRAQRRPGFDVTHNGSSWFGGLPALGSQTWPTDAGGQLMTPLAQIDLAGLAEHLKIPNLPETGSLAFFAALPEQGKMAGAVRYVPGAVGKLTPPDQPLPPVLNHSFGGAMRRGAPGADQTLYPRMAMERVLVSANDQETPEAFKAEIEQQIGPGREFNLAPSLFEDVMPLDRQPYNRDSLLRFLHGAKIALGNATQAELRKFQANYATSAKGLTAQLETAAEGHARLQTGLKNTLSALRRVEEILADFPSAVSHLSKGLSALESWAKAGDPWQPLTETEQEMLAPLLEPWTTSGARGWSLLKYSYAIHHRMSDCVKETLLVMAVAEDKVFATLPAPVRDAVNGPWRQAYEQRRHKMFGTPDSVQTAAAENAHAYLLVQLQCDDVAGFQWGDAGVLQFWIRPDDLGAGHWDKAYMTFEGH